MLHNLQLLHLVVFIFLKIMVLVQSATITFSCFYMLSFVMVCTIYNYYMYSSLSFIIHDVRTVYNYYIQLSLSFIIHHISRMLSNFNHITQFNVK